MQHWDVIFWIGVLLIVLGIVFLPFKPPENVKIGVKLFGAEFEINTPAIALTLLGAALALAVSLLPPPPPAQIVPPAQVASMPLDTSKPPGQGGPREEGEEDKRLENAGYDADKLKPLAASTIPAVREEVNRRLDQIEKDDENLKSAAYDRTKLQKLEHDAQSPKVRDEALDRLKVIDEDEKSLESAAYDTKKLLKLEHDAQSPKVRDEAGDRLNAIEKDRETLNSAGYDRPKLTTLMTGAHSPEVRAEVGDRPQVIETEEKSLTSAVQDKTALAALAHDAHSPEVQAEARRRLDTVAKEPNEAAKKNTVPEEAPKPPQQIEPPTPKSVSPLVGYTLFAVIDKNNNIKKQYLNIDGKPDQKFPAPNDIVIAIKERAIFAIPYHWDINSGTNVHPSDKLTQLKEGQKAKVGGDVFVSSDPNGDRYVIAPISSLIGTDYTGAKSNFTPVASAPKILGYVYIGKIDDGSNKLKFLNTTHRDAIYPAANDTMVATTDVWLHAGPRYWDATKQEYVDTGKVQMIKTGQTVVAGGDTILGSGGTSIWTPVAAINAETPAPPPARQAPKPLRDTPLAPERAANVPSFPCTGSLSRVEALICNDPELAKLDMELKRTYQKALNALQGEQQQELKTEQLAWIKTRAACKDNGAIRKCVADAYGRRLLSLRSRYGSAAN